MVIAIERAVGEAQDVVPVEANPGEHGEVEELVRPNDALYGRWPTQELEHSSDRVGHAPQEEWPEELASVETPDSIARDNPDPAHAQVKNEAGAFGDVLEEEELQNHADPGDQPNQHDRDPAPTTSKQDRVTHSA